MIYTVRSEREYNLLVRGFVALNMDEPVWVATLFSKNRDRLLEGDLAERFFDGVLKQAREADLLSDEHFSVDGTLIEAWGSREFSAERSRGEPPADDPGKFSARGSVSASRDSEPLT